MTDSEQNTDTSETQEIPSETDSSQEQHAIEVAAPVDPLEEMTRKYEAALQESKDNYDRLLRLKAEFDNYKKRNSRENETFRKYANESLLKDILPIVDNMERALQSSNQQQNASVCIAEGIEMTLRELLKVVERFGVKQVEALGKVFDPNFHQAMMQEESETDAEPMVVRELQKGYTLYDRLLRPAMVIVSKPKQKPEAQEITDNNVAD